MGRREVKPTAVVNKHGTRFLLMAYTEVESADGLAECAELADSDGFTCWVPVDLFMSAFSVEGV